MWSQSPQGKGKGFLAKVLNWVTPFHDHFLDDDSGKESASAEDVGVMGSIPGLKRSPRGGNGNPF